MHGETATLQLQLGIFDIPVTELVETACIVIKQIIIIIYSSRIIIIILYTAAYMLTGRGGTGGVEVYNGIAKFKLMNSIKNSRSP